MTRAEKTAVMPGAGRLEEENGELRARVRELEEALDAIRRGEVDAIVVSRGGANRVYALEGANDSYRALVERIPEGALTMSVEGMILYANAAFLRMRQLPLSHVLGSAVRDHVAPRDRARFDALLRSSRSAPQECDLSLRGGSASFPAHLSLTPTEVGDQATISVMITDRRRDYGRLLLQSRMLDSVLDAVMAVDPDGTIVYWNEAAERLYGWTAAELVGRGASEVFEPVVPDGSRPSFEELRAGETWSGEFLARHRDGHRFPVQGTRAPVFDEDGTLVAIIDTSHDITDRKRAEAALRESEAQYRHLFENIEEMVSVYEVERDGGGAIVERRLREANPAFVRAVGVPSVDEIRGKTSRELFGTAWSEAHLSAVRKAMDTGEVQVQEVYRPDSGRHYITSVVRLDADTYLGTGRDITERTRAEEALRQSQRDYQALLDHSLLAYARCRTLFDADGVPDDYEIVEVNEAYLAMTGLSDVVGKRITGVIPGMERDLIDFHNEVALTGVPRQAEVYSGPLDRWYSVNVYSPAPGEFVALSRDSTERVRMERELAESRATLRAALGSMADAVFISDADGRFVEFNDAFVAYHRFGSRDECSRSFETCATLFDVWFGDTGEPAPPERWAIPRALAGESGAGVEYVLRRRDTGETWTGLYTFAPLRDGDGGIVGSVVTARDITERKQAEEALREREERQAFLLRFSDLLRDQPDEQAIAELAVTMLAEHLGLDRCWVSEVFLEQGYSTVGPERIRPDLPPMTGVFQLSDYPETMRQLSTQPVEITDAVADPRFSDAEKALHAGLHLRALLVVPLRKGQRGVVWTLAAAMATPCAWTGGERALQEEVAERTWAAIERARGQAALRESEARLAAERERFFAILETVPIMVCLLTPDYHVAYANRAFREKFGEANGRHCYEYCWGLSELCPFCESFVPLETGQPHHWVCTSPDGSTVVDAHDYPFTDLDGSPLILEMDIDITERVRAEETLRGYAESLKRSNEDLERFAYVASHDLQEPLRSIVSFTQLLERRYRGRLDAEADEYLDFIVEGGTRMQGLILDLLQFSRVNTTRQQIARTDAEDVLAEAERTLETSLREAEATLTHDPMPVVMADPTQLLQVFSNLVSNAIKFRKPDVPLRIHVGAKRLDGFWEFSVRDNGIGIEPEYFEKIFVIFQRLHTKETYPGTGIGLAIVKRIVERHGGSIRVESTPGEGATFFFTLPAA